jgi:hypothetical protein
MSIDLYRKVLANSYTHKDQVIDGFTIDPELSNQRAQVYQKDGEALVVHRGTTASIKDWSNNLIYALGSNPITGTTLYRSTARFKNAERIQRAAEAKYGANHITTVGHSQGGLLASMLGKRGRSTITLDKPALVPQLIGKAPNETSYRSRFDVVSLISGLEPQTKVIGSASLNPLVAHDVNELTKNKKPRKGVTQFVTHLAKSLLLPKSL